MATPRRANTSIGLAGFVVVFACSKSSPPSIKHDAAAAPVAADAAPLTDRGRIPSENQNSPSGGKITISVAKPRTPGAGYAKRVAIGGPPLESTCIGGSNGLAFDKAGILYLANESKLHRFTIADDKLEPKDAIDFPPANPRPQELGTARQASQRPLYMRSGGPAWELVQTPDAIYAHDFLGGLFRVDRGKPEAACVDEFGFRTIVYGNKRMLGLRKGVEELRLGKKCKAKPAGIDDKARELFAVGDTVYTSFDDLGVRICSARAMTACGEGACIVDHNCPKIVQLDAGKLLREIDGDKLFDTRPWSLLAAATAPDGTVYIHARHRDTIALGVGKEVCETAVYAVPAAVFAK